MRFVRGGELFMHLRKARQFSEKRAKFYSLTVALALGHLHQQKIIYRDLKPENILMKGDEAMLADFGQAKVLNKVGASSPFCTSRYYRAPELILASTYYNAGVDMWAAGSILFELFTKVVMFHAPKHEAETLIEIQQLIGSPTEQDLNSLANQFKVNKEFIKKFRELVVGKSNEGIDLIELLRPRQSRFSQPIYREKDLR